VRILFRKKFAARLFARFSNRRIEFVFVVGVGFTANVLEFTVHLAE
jgi:hypothetical protein